MPEPMKRGRPPVAPGEASVELGASVEVSLYRKLRFLAQQRQESVNEVVRSVLRGFFLEKIDGAERRP